MGITPFRIFAVALLFNSFHHYCQCTGVTCYTKARIKTAIKHFLGEGCHRTAVFHEWPSRSGKENIEVEHYTTSGIMIWDVLRTYSSVIGDVLCPFCAEKEIAYSLRPSEFWSDGSSNCRYEPRVVYDTSSSLLLVSAVYTCPQNHQVPSHHPSVLGSLPSSCYYPFYLTNRAGFTVEFLSQITGLVDRGTSFSRIEGMVREQYEQTYWRMRLRYEEDCSSAKISSTNFPPFSQTSYPYPHEKIIKDVFISYSMLFMPMFNEDMARRD